MTVSQWASERAGETFVPIVITRLDTYSL